MKIKIFALSFFLYLATNASCQTTECNESNKWKYEDYTRKPFFANQIFTKGYGIYFSFEKKRKGDRIDKVLKDSLENDILNGFRVALTNWGVSLLMNKDILSSEILSYLDEYSFKTGNNSTYNAPPVFKVDCLENANFVIKIFYEKGKRFKDDSKILAMAQIKGRTILLNMQGHRLVYEQKLFNIKLNKDYNIVPIIAHELGHCFGLGHTDIGTSIMAPNLKTLSNFPTKNDGLNFSKILAKKLVGKSAGYFNPSECAGLMIE